MDERGLHDRINELVASERDLRAQAQRGELSSDEERERLAAAEVELDRLWDLLRQREARRNAGQDPDEATERDGATVEKYLN